MSEEKAKLIVDLVNEIAENRAGQILFTYMESSTHASECAEDARKAMQLLKETLLMGVSE